jgi:hypothetical protein
MSFLYSIIAAQYAGLALSYAALALVSHVSG